MQSTTGTDSTEQYNTAQYSDSTAQFSAEQDSTAQFSAEQDSTAQYSAERDSTAPTGAEPTGAEPGGGTKQHRVERAIIMAAGKGERMRPITEKIPKPMISVNGKRMIESVIEALHTNGIYEIYVVVGYLREHFAVLEEQFPGVKLIENPYFDTCNNISSLYVAREHLENCMILDGDQIIFDPGILAPEFELSGYNAVWTDGETDEWLMTVKDGIVTGCSRTGGKRGWQLYSISRWSEQDGARLRRHLELEFEERGNRQIYWDDVAMFCHFDEYRLGIRPMLSSDIIEIDNIEELREADPAYR